jgi:CheY-like chemotaxis protein
MTRAGVVRILIVEDTPARQEILTRLCKDHAWVLAPTARRAITLLGSYDFDLVFLDYDLAGPEKGDPVAVALAQGRNRAARVIVHSMNAGGARKISEILPQADLVPLSKMTRNNATFKRLQAELARGANLDWQGVFRRQDTSAGEDHPQK